MKKMLTSVFALLLVVILAGSALAEGKSMPGADQGNWIGAPCMSDDDCGDYKCCSGACAESCYASEFQVSTWIGAPCMSDDDCGDYKCCGGACAESCYYKGIKIGGCAVAP